MKFNYKLLVYKSKKSKAKRRSVRLEKIIQNRAIKRGTKQIMTKEIADELLYAHHESLENNNSPLKEDKVNLLKKVVGNLDEMV